ncbi:hypothetical protein CYMTET_52641 [Cymbomonas tetramitiformis]|uniref:Uncharacterized protein n=1 Tax=Cymbomonas tetramitiformis TaxID=36881 RepID=A0AAE0BKC5_9CHLO|nr:hypothetical protein CYMTET_52641 [Cymbomonas tetramitiformis]
MLADPIGPILINTHPAGYRAMHEVKTPRGDEGLVVQTPRYRSLQQMYDSSLEKITSCTTDILNEFLLQPLREVLAPLDAQEELQQAAVSKLSRLPGLDSVDADLLLKRIANNDFSGISAQLAAQPLVSSLGLSMDAIQCILKGELDEVEKHVSKALDVHSMRGRAVIRAILSTCPPWGRASPPPGLLQAVETLSKEANIPVPIAKALASFIFASVRYKNSKTQWNASTEHLLEQEFGALMCLKMERCHGAPLLDPYAASFLAACLPLKAHR